MLYKADVEPPKPFDVTPNETFDVRDPGFAEPLATFAELDAICDTEKEALNDPIEARALTAGTDPLAESDVIDAEGELTGELAHCADAC